MELKYIRFRKLFTFFIIILVIIVPLQIIFISGTSKSMASQINYYYGTTILEYKKEKTPLFYELTKTISGYYLATLIHFNKSNNEINLKIIINYSATMNNTAGFPHTMFAPIGAFGLQIENYSDYSWALFKLKRDGYSKQEGNLSTTITFNMSNYQSGDEILLHPIVVVIGDPRIYITIEQPKKSLYTSLFFRFVFNSPTKNKWMLYHIALPFFAKRNIFNSSDIIHIIVD